MGTRQLAVLLVASSAFLASAYELPTGPETMRLVAEAARKTRALDAREQAAAGDAQARVQLAWELEYQLASPYDPKRVADLNRQLETAEQDIARLQGELSQAGVESAEERAAKHAEADIEVQAALEARRVAMAPFREEEAAFQATLAPLNQALETFGQGFVRVPEGLGIATVHVNASALSGMVLITWQTAAQSTVCSGQLQLGDPQVPQGRGGRLLADKYPILLSRKGAIRLLAGEVQVMLHGQQTEWKSPDKLLELAGKLVDLEGLAGLTALPAESPQRDTMRQAAECLERTRELHVRRQAGTRQAEDSLARATAKRQEFSKPYDAKRVASMQRRLAGCEGSIASLRSHLAVATTEDPEQRKAKREQVRAELLRLQQDLLEAKAPFRAERVALDKEYRLADFALWNLLNGVLRAPEDLAGVEAEVSNLRPATCAVTVRWLDARRRQVAVAELHFGLRPGDLEEQAKVSGTYPVHALREDRVGCWVGGVSVDLNVQSQEWQDKAKILELVAKLMDLDAMAAWPVAEEAP